jgi:hypothetical protein
MVATVAKGGVATKMIWLVATAATVRNRKMIGCNGCDGCDAELRNQDYTGLAPTVAMMQSPYDDRLRCWASQPQSWSVALLAFTTAKTKKRPVTKLSIATNHFIS